MCSYKYSVSFETVEIVADLVEIRRLKSPSLEEMMVNMEIDRQRNRLLAAEAIKEAQEMAEAGDLGGARSLLEKKRSDLLATASAQAGDGMCKWLANEMEETEMLMGSSMVYQQAGRAYALSGLISHGYQRATTRAMTKANVVPEAPPLPGPGHALRALPAFGAPRASRRPGRALGAFPAFGAPQASRVPCGLIFGAAAHGVSDSSEEDMGFGLDDNMTFGSGLDANMTFGCGSLADLPLGCPAFKDNDSGSAAYGCPYTTPNMVNMVKKSQQVSKSEEGTIANKD